MKRTVLIVALSILMLGAMCHRHSDFEGNTGVLKGDVIDSATREPLIGACIQLKGTDLGALTDINGKFKLVRVPTGVDTIVVTYIGFVTTELVYDINPRTTSDCRVAMVLAPILNTPTGVISSGHHRWWANLRGIVKDSATRLPVVGAKVKVDFPRCETLTDSSGRFRLDCAWVGKFQVKISRKAYHTRKLRDVEISRDSTEFEFILVPKK